MADSEKKTYEGHRERMRQQFRDGGLEGWPGHHILEMLLFYSIRRGNTKEIARELYKRNGNSIYNVVNAKYDALLKVEGIGPESATLIKFISEFIGAYMDDYASKNDIITDHETAKNYMAHMFLSQQSECILLACLGNNGKVVCCEKIAEGSAETVSVSPSTVVRAALKAEGTVRAVIAHNHPNGICLPSGADLRTTSIFYNELHRVDVELIDHIIVAPDGVYSMAENNMFPRTGYVR